MNSYEIELKNKKEQALKMFFLSIKKDIQSWTRNSTNYKSKKYGENHDQASFRVETKKIKFICVVDFQI